MNTAPLLVVVGSSRLLVNNGKFVCGGGVICGKLVAVERVDVKIGGIDSVVDADEEVLDVLESVSVSDSDDVVDVVLELVVKAAGGEGDGGPGGGVVGDGKDVESSSSSASSRAVSSASSVSSAFVSRMSSASSLFMNAMVLSKGGVCRPSRTSSSSCCLTCTYAAAHCSPLRRASNESSRRATISSDRKSVV